MAETLLVAGTASHVGKSTVATGLCRLLADRGVDVAPFKAQNMSNNARAVPRSSGDGEGEVGVSQYVQAHGARVAPTTDHNPVLLKPTGEGRSQVVLDGEAVGHVEAGAYYETYWEQARETARAAHARLAAAHDVVVAEGAGSIAEVNLQHRDLANVETARFADADILLVADIERGGVFAHIYGTLELMPADLRECVVGVLITKFRGDRSLLA
ncbi:MAG: adenosylcobyric acid synthase, partial [Salinirussus sp.]